MQRMQNQSVHIDVEQSFNLNVERINSDYFQTEGTWKKSVFVIYYNMLGSNQIEE